MYDIIKIDNKKYLLYNININDKARHAKAMKNKFSPCGFVTPKNKTIHFVF